MKKTGITFFLIFITAVSFGQLVDPVSWSYKAIKTPAGKYDLVMSAVIEGSWHIYSQYTVKGGPSGTSIRFSPNPLIAVIGKPKEVGNIVKIREGIFGEPVTVSYFNEKVKFVQSIAVKTNVKTNISGTIDYMLCNDRLCAGYKKSFDVSLD